jgi:hypothetical protein
MIRRERVRIDASDDSPAHNRLQGRVVDRVYEGWAVEYVVEVGANRVRVLSEDLGYRVGQDVRLVVDKRDVQFLPSS